MRAEELEGAGELLVADAAGDLAGGGLDHERDEDADEREREVAGGAAEVGGGDVADDLRDEEVDDEVDHAPGEVGDERQPVGAREQEVAARHGEEGGHAGSSSGRIGDDAGGAVDVVGEVRGDDDGGVWPAGERGPHALARLLVERAGGLVEQDHAGVADERAGERELLQLAGGAAVGAALRDLLELELADELPHADRGGLLAEPAQPGEEEQVLEAGEAQVERALLRERGADEPARARPSRRGGRRR